MCAHSLTCLGKCRTPQDFSKLQFFKPSFDVQTLSMLRTYDKSQYSFLIKSSFRIVKSNTLSFTYQNYFQWATWNLNSDILCLYLLLVGGPLSFRHSPFMILPTYLMSSLIFITKSLSSEGQVLMIKMDWDFDTLAYQIS